MAGKTLGFCVRIYCLSASSGTKKIKTVLRFWVSLWKAWLCKFLNSSPNLKPICDGVFTLNTPGSVTLVIIMGWRRKTLPGGGGHWNTDAILVLTGAHGFYLGVVWPQNVTSGEMMEFSLLAVLITNTSLPHPEHTLAVTLPLLVHRIQTSVQVQCRQ